MSGWSSVLQRMMESGLEGAIGRYYSVYRGRVVDTADPQRQDRIKVHVPRVSVGGDAPLPTWAYPILPTVTGGAQTGSSEVPPVGALVWVMFEDGQINKPVYMAGGWWADGEKPAVFDGVDWRGWVSTGGHRFLRHDPEQGSGELVWQHADGHAIRQLEGGAIELTSGQTIAKIEGGKVTLDTGSGQTIVMEGGKITVSGGAQVQLKASTIVLDAQSVALGDAGASAPLVKGTALASYLLRLVIWLATHVHGPPGSPPVAPPPPFIASSILSRKSRTS